MDNVSFDGQAVIVTGAGRGLGRAYALELARRGAAVVVNDVAVESADEVVAEISAAGGTAVASHHSVASVGGGQAIVDLAVEAFGTVDALINNAGILRNNFFEDMTSDQIEEVLAVNLHGVFYVTQPAWRIMKAKGYGRVVLTSSAAGFFARGGSVNYSASKAAMYGMCRALSFEGADHDVKINVLLPRARTTITAGNAVPGLRPPGDRSPQLRAAFESRVDPGVSAALACYLASSDCAVSGEAFSTAFGCYSRVFVGRTRGWLAADPAAISIEDVIANLDPIRDIEPYTVPLSNTAEDEAVAELLGFGAGSAEA